MPLCHSVHTQAQFKIRFVEDEKGAYTSTAALCLCYAKCVLGIKGNTGEVFRCLQYCETIGHLLRLIRCYRTLLIDSTNKFLEAFILYCCQTRRSLDDVQHMLMHLQV
jgi:hypothetical protein